MNIGGPRSLPAPIHGSVSDVGPWPAEGAIAHVATRPMAITESGLAETIQALQTKDAPPLKSSVSATVRGRVAIVPVKGPLFNSMGYYSYAYGWSTYEGIARDMLAAAENDDVGAIVLDVDSPGGDAFGCGEVARLIAGLRGKKPIVAYAAGQMCSAAYWIGSAADRIVTDPTAQLGSIGTRCSMVDNTKFYESLGIKLYPIVSEQSPYKVPDASKEADRERVRAQMTDMSSVFITDVAKNRGVSESKVERDFGKGDVLVGQRAVDAGLADALGDLDSVVAFLNASTPSKSAFGAQGDTSMTTPQNAIAPTPPHNAAGSGAKCSGCKSSMKEGDKAYCASCFDGDGDEDDEESKKSKSFRTSVLSILGESDDAKALGQILALTKGPADVQALRAELETLRKEKTSHELDGLLASVAPAQRDEVRALANKFGIDAAKGFLAVGAKASTPAQPRDPSKPPTAEQGDVAAVGAPALSGELAKLFKQTGMTPEKFATAQTRYADVMTNAAKAATEEK